MKTKVNTEFFYRGNDILKIWEKHLLKVDSQNISFYCGRIKKTLFSEKNPLFPTSESAILLDENSKLFKINGYSVTVSGAIENSLEEVKKAFLDIFKQMEHFQHNFSENFTKHTIIFPYHTTPAHWSLAVINLDKISTKNEKLDIEKINIQLYDSLYETDNNCINKLQDTLEKQWPSAQILVKFKYTLQQQDLTSSGAITAENGKIFLSEFANNQKEISINFPYESGAKQLRRKHINEISLEAFEDAQKSHASNVTNKKSIDDPSFRADLISIIRMKEYSWIKDILAHIHDDEQGKRDKVKLLKELIIFISNDPEKRYFRTALLKNNNKWQDGAIDFGFSVFSELERKEKNFSNTNLIPVNAGLEESSEVSFHNNDYILDIEKDNTDWSKESIDSKHLKLMLLGSAFVCSNTTDLELLTAINTAFNILDSLVNNLAVNNESTNVILIGTTGSGKTTIAHYLEKGKLIAKDQGLAFRLNIEKKDTVDHRTIGNGHRSETFLPNLFRIEGLENHQVIDIAGLQDNKGIFARLANEFINKKNFSNSQSSKIVFIIPFTAVQSKDFSSTIQLVSNTLVGNIEDIEDPKKIHFSCFINMVPSSVTKFENAAELVSRELLEGLQANRANIPSNLYIIMQNNFKRVGLIVEAMENGIYNFPEQREQLVEIIATAKEVPLKYFFGQDSNKLEDFLRKIQELDRTNDLIKFIKKKVYLQLNKLKIKVLDANIFYCQSAGDVIEKLNRLRKIKIFEDEEGILLIKRQLFYLSTLKRAEKYCLKSEIGEIIDKIQSKIELVLSEVQNFIEELDNINAFSTNIHESKLTIKAPYVSTKSVNNIVNECETSENMIDTIKIFALAIDFNCSLNFPSKSLFIKAKNFTIKQPVSINLSGLDAKVTYGSTTGKNSGHFILDLRAYNGPFDDWHDYKKLTITTNGGYGLDGKDGKKGDVGQNIMHLAGNQSSAEKSLFSNNEQIELLEKLINSEKNSSSNASDLIKFIREKAVENKDALKRQLKIAKLTEKVKKIEMSGYSTLNSSTDVAGYDFLNFSKLPKPLVVRVKISFGSHFQWTALKYVESCFYMDKTIDFKPLLKEINEEFYLAHYKPSLEIYETALNKALANLQSIRDDFLNAVRKSLEDKRESIVENSDFGIEITAPGHQIYMIERKNLTNISDTKVDFLTLILQNCNNFILGLYDKYLRDLELVKPYYFKAYCSVVYKDTQFLASRNKFFTEYIGRNVGESDLIFDPKLYPELDTSAELTKLRIINNLLDKLTKNAHAARTFVNILWLKNWVNFYDELLRLWSKNSTEKMKVRDIPVCASLVKIINNGYQFNSSKIIDFSMLYKPIEADSPVSSFIGDDVVGLERFILGAARLIDSKSHIPSVKGSQELSSANLIFNSTKSEDGLTNFAFEIRSVGPSKICYGKKGENGQDGGKGGDSGEIIIFISTIEENSSGKIGVGGNGGKGGEMGENGIVEYLLVARQFDPKIPHKIGDEMIQLGHFYSRLPKDFEYDEYQEYLTENSSINGRQGDHGQVASIPHDQLNEFLQSDLHDELQEYIDSEYNIALMGEEVDQ